MSASIDQQRAAYAWERATARRDAEGYRELAKGAPALIMGSGLMAALAFWQSRKKGPGKELVQDLLGWFAKRKELPADFPQAMKAMAGQASAAQYMALTDEALALLRWLRQFCDAVSRS
jgi:CRISPR-associated protein Cmr5